MPQTSIPYLARLLAEQTSRAVLIQALDALAAELGPEVAESVLCILTDLLDDALDPTDDP